MSPVDGWRLLESMLWRQRRETVGAVEIPPEVAAAALAAELRPNPFGRGLHELAVDEPPNEGQELAA
jgi:hypothetical protein